MSRNKQAMHDEHTKKAMKRHHHGSLKGKKSLADTDTPRRFSGYFPDSDVNNDDSNSNYSTPPATKHDPAHGAAGQTPSPGAHRHADSSSTTTHSSKLSSSRQSSIFSSLPSRQPSIFSSTAQTPSSVGFTPDVSFNGDVESPDTAQPPPGQRRMFFSSPGDGARPPRPTRPQR